MSSEQMVSVPEAAERLGVAEETIRRQIREGKLPATRAGGGERAPWRISVAYLEHVLAVKRHEDQVRKHREVGLVGGRGEESLQQIKQTHGPELAERARENLRRARAAELVYSVEDFGFEKLDDERGRADSIERAARALAARMRWEEQVCARAVEILAAAGDEIDDRLMTSASKLRSAGTRKPR